MLRKFLVGFLIEEEFFFACFPQDADYFFRRGLLFKMPFYAEAGTSFEYILLVGFGEITFREAEIINRIQQVGLANAIVTANAYNPFPELEICLFVIFELYERYLF